MNRTPFYKNRKDAAKRLISYLNQYENTDSVILSIPNGGIPIGKTLSKELGLPLFLAPIKKIKHPDINDVNIGALSLENIVLDSSMGISTDDVEEQINRLRAELRQELSVKGSIQDKPSLKNKNVIITDDGITFGSTMLATLQLIEKEAPKKKILAVPVATYRSLNKLQDYVDKIVCLHMPEMVDNVASYYEQFDNLSNRDIESILAK